MADFCATINGRTVESFKVTARRTNQSVRNLYRRAGKAGFPAAVRLGANKVGFFVDEIDAWLASRPRVTYGPEAEVATATTQSKR